MYVLCFLQSSPESIFVQANQNSLYPSHTYSHVSGGLPINILDLTVCALQFTLVCVGETISLVQSVHIYLGSVY